jgi:PilZ domain-containing protein
MAPKAPSRAGTQARRSERVLLKIPIQVKGKGTDGKPFQEKTFTLVINRHGARVTMKSNPRPNDQITVTNLYNNSSCPFRVVGRTGQSLGQGPEWGVECLEPDRDFWGIYFPEKKGAADEVELIDALLECAKCGSRELAQMEREQYQALTAQSSIRRPCPKCKKETDWKFSFVEDELGELFEANSPPEPVATEPAVGAKTERRKAKRLTLKVPLRVRLENGREEITRTENYSKTGACFISKLDMKPNQRLFLTVGYAAGSNEIESRARVVWRRSVEGTQQHVYGVELEERN